VKSSGASNTPGLGEARLSRKGQLSQSCHDESQPSSSSESEYATNRTPSLHLPSSLFRSRFLLAALRLGDPSTTSASDLTASVSIASVATDFVASDATGAAATHTSATGGAICGRATRLTAGTTVMHMSRSRRSWSRRSRCASCVCHCADARPPRPPPTEAPAAPDVLATALVLLGTAPTALAFVELPKIEPFVS